MDFEIDGNPCCWRDWDNCCGDWVSLFEIGVCSALDLAFAWVSALARAENFCLRDSSSWGWVCCSISVLDFSYFFSVVGFFSFPCSSVWILDLASCLNALKNLHFSALVTFNSLWWSIPYFLFTLNFRRGGLEFFFFHLFGVLLFPFNACLLFR